jgi:hypothetical protein
VPANNTATASPIIQLEKRIEVSSGTQCQLSGVRRPTPGELQPFHANFKKNAGDPQTGRNLGRVKVKIKGQSGGPWDNSV